MKIHREYFMKKVCFTYQIQSLFCIHWLIYMFYFVHYKLHKHLPWHSIHIYDHNQQAYKHHWYKYLLFLLRVHMVFHLRHDHRERMNVRDDHRQLCKSICIFQPVELNSKKEDVNSISNKSKSFSSGKHFLRFRSTFDLITLQFFCTKKTNHIVHYSLSLSLLISWGFDSFFSTYRYISAQIECQLVTMDRSYDY